MRTSPVRVKPLAKNKVTQQHLFWIHLQTARLNRNLGSVKQLHLFSQKGPRTWGCLAPAKRRCPYPDLLGASCDFSARSYEPSKAWPPRREIPSVCWSMGFFSNTMNKKWVVVVAVAVAAAAVASGAGAGAVAVACAAAVVLFFCCCCCCCCCCFLCHGCCGGCSSSSSSSLLWIILVLVLRFVLHSFASFWEISRSPMIWNICDIKISNIRRIDICTFLSMVGNSTSPHTKRAFQVRPAAVQTKWSVWALEDLFRVDLRLVRCFCLSSKVKTHTSS